MITANPHPPTVAPPASLLTVGGDKSPFPPASLRADATHKTPHYERMRLTPLSENGKRKLLFPNDPGNYINDWLVQSAACYTLT
ncbi:hypothetical protein TNCV_1287851 [Trichonephila clavipes]|nr:hypothetical protein TNCV_1287851 [Trichonephila clavipes]